jgi:hypothetical protein
MKKKMKLELTLAMAMTVTLAALAIYTSLPRSPENRVTMYLSSSTRSLNPSSLQDTSGPSTQQVIMENIQGELRRGEFETTVEGLRNLTSDYGGRIPTLHMTYDNELWSGTLECKLPTDNVTWFTFEVRKLVNAHGKVTHILIDVKEFETNQTQTSETPLSDISIYLHEYVEGSSPFMNQLGAVVPLLMTGLVWIAEGLIVGVPLCFACLGVIVVVSRGIVPVWKREFRKKSLTKEVTGSTST